MRYLILSFALLFSCSLTMCACSQDHDEPAAKEDTATEPDRKDDKVLIAYFSCTDVTKGVAEEIADITSGTLFRIEPREAYTAADLDYNSDCRANREQQNPAARPAIKELPADLTEYDVIFLGYPIWWGKAPRVISTFLEGADFRGKTSVPFCTSHSSSLGSSDTDLHSLAPDAVWKPGKRFPRGATKAQIESWINGLGDL